MTEKTLHACRIAGKHSRYIAELAGDTLEASLFIEELKRAQDAIGEWHDIVKLKQKAEKRFGSASDSALVSMLQNVSRARFRAACNTLTSTLSVLSRQQVLTPRPPSPAHETAPSEAVSRRVAPRNSFAEIAQSRAVA